MNEWYKVVAFSELMSKNSTRKCLQYKGFNTFISHVLFHHTLSHGFTWQYGNYWMNWWRQDLIFSYDLKKNNQISRRKAKTQISLGISLVWYESSIYVQGVTKDQSYIHADNENSDHPELMPWPISVFAWGTGTLLIFLMSLLITFWPLTGWSISLGPRGNETFLCSTQLSMN